MQNRNGSGPGKQNGAQPTGVPGGGGGVHRGSRSWWSAGPPIGSALGGIEPEPVEVTNKTLGERWTEWKKQTRATLAGIPGALNLVWSTHKGYTLAMALLSVVFGLVPAASAFVS